MNYGLGFEFPNEVLEKAVEALELTLIVARDGNPNSVSDAGVGGSVALAAAEGAALNVRINLPSLTDQAVANQLDASQSRLLSKARDLAQQTRSTVESTLKGV